jgi:hypothetical protein
MPKIATDLNLGLIRLRTGDEAKKHLAKEKTLRAPVISKADKAKMKHKKVLGMDFYYGKKEKDAGVLPEFLAKPRRGEKLEPGSEDFMKNQAFGRAVGSGGVPGWMVGGALGAVAGGRKGSVPGMLLGGAGGAALGGAAGTAAMYPSKLRKQREKSDKKKDKTAAAYSSMALELEKWAINPALLGGLLGAGAGALAGGEGRRLKGALLGGAAGAGGGALAGKHLARGAAKAVKAAPRAGRHVEQRLPKVVLQPGKGARAAQAAPKPSSSVQALKKAVSPSQAKTHMGGMGQPGLVTPAKSGQTMAGVAPAPSRGVAKTVGMAPTGGAPPVSGVRPAGVPQQNMGELVRQARSAQPTAAGGQRIAASMKNVPADTMRQAKGAITPEMAAMGMTPERAVQVMGMSGGGQPISNVVAREVAGQASRGIPGRTFMPAAANMATKAASALPFMLLELIKAGSIDLQDVKDVGGDIGEELGEAIGDAAEQTPRERTIGSIIKFWKHSRGKKKTAGSLQREATSPKFIAQGLASLGAIYGAHRLGKHVRNRKKDSSGKKKTAGPYLLDKLHVEPKIRNFKAEAPEEKHRVKQSAAVGINDPAKRLAESQKIGVPQTQTPKVKPMNIKIAFAESMYSGGTGRGHNNYVSQIPAFTAPPLKTAGPPSEGEDKKKKAKTKEAAMVDELMKLNAISSPQGQLGKTQRIGAPRVTAPPGPSIHQIAKPVGFGRPAPGSTKGAI